MPVKITPAMAAAAGKDAANRQMKAEGRTKWNRRDWNLAAKTANHILLATAGMLLFCLGCATTETHYAVEYRADAARPAEGVIVAGVSGGFSSVLR